MGATFLEAVTLLPALYGVADPAATAQRYTELGELRQATPRWPSGSRRWRAGPRGDGRQRCGTADLRYGSARGHVGHRAMLVAYKMAPATHWFANGW